MNKFIETESKRLSAARGEENRDSLLNGTEFALGMEKFWK